MACFKFAKVHQNPGEPVDTFYQMILKIACQFEYSDMEECIIDAIIYGTNYTKDPHSTTMPVLRHYESSIYESLK